MGGIGLPVGEGPKTSQPSAQREGVVNKNEDLVSPVTKPEAGTSK